MQPKMWLSSPHMGGTEQDFVNEAFETNWVAPLGPNVDGFEKDIASFLGNKIHVAALTSGTAAIHLALVQAGVTQGDVVLCQSFTFSASANPIVYQGAMPVFIDSEATTWNMDPNYLEDAIQHYIAKGQKPKAVIVVHLYGMPANMQAITALAAKYEITLIEDAAEALGSSLHGQPMGTFSQYGVLSFNGNKIITTSGGGALVSASAETIATTKFLATQARDAAPHYQHSHIGFNYRMSNISAGIGRGQMQVLPQRVQQRRANHAFYQRHLSTLPCISFLEEPTGYYSNRWLTTILCSQAANTPDRESIRLQLDAQNIESRPLWKPMHLQPVFQNAPYFGGNVAEQLFANGLCLPSGSNLTTADLDRVIGIIKNLYQ
ncbi:MAG: aminotransferase class I/II-fold pyridoxal phosphate-dependent enzyme [Bacteroidetes bacterium]|nr:MAG: aminotransferase class I/II-fold pyridoxal phosphate-dependent enzyme [Bacteroidota bacterium]